MKKASVPELKVLFDTNALYTNAATYLARMEVSEFIAKNSTYPDLKVSWMLPSIILEERRYQMLKAATQLLPNLQKLEKLLGMNFGLTEGTLSDRVRDAVEKDRASLGFQIAKLDHENVSWADVISAAVNRRPPFDLQAEKGFRDAVAVETFLQEVERSPKSPNLCRLAFVSGDGLVRQAVESRTSGMSNVRLCADLTELGGLINTLISSVDENYVTDVKSKAAKLFYDYDAKAGFYMSADIYRQLSTQYETVLTARPEGIDQLMSGALTLALPQFVSKSSNLLTWMSLLTISQTMKRMKSAAAEAPPYGLLSPGPLTASGSQQRVGIVGSAMNLGLQPPTNTRLLSTLLTAEYEDVGTRTLRFEIFWTCRVNHQRKLSNLKLVRVDHDPD